MGDWHISIQGTGAHHNKDFTNDADKMVDRFLDELIMAGHDIKSATITYGGRQVYNLGAKKSNKVLNDLINSNPDQVTRDRISIYAKTLEKQKTFLE